MNGQIDDLDRGIIKCLSSDGRMSFTEIATQLNVTEKTIRSRYKNLIDHEILQVVGVVNPTAIGVKAGAIIELKVELVSLEKVIEDLKALREVRFITTTSGKYQLITQIAVPAQDDLSTSFKRIRNIQGIVEMNSIIQLQVYKNTFQYI
ncbi:Lrp/AsnC family transcriptional regulator for asnA, asnC and gidA [Bacillus mesophilus]|uniref:Lrp/AsnC family transcriptional regulator n=1 Tax=Bacillus mesophilus TaxID=1808955 RepID=A0A6M0Q8D9_9BACI|nr:Lrp/AsnC family transcriptional regulator [Bacillus mesophilus]MBM7662007.1 Lrp/AsnC family transcriptional regulator for asnA, asnC and gidA [Bacillus mesophilus]NEY72636.1 Lrp/AsnC family transcriptional regulator [Bacillus mesophilus]